jgi:hypothetical protein
MARPGVAAGSKPKSATKSISVALKRSSTREIVAAVRRSQIVVIARGKFRCGPAPEFTHFVRSGTRATDQGFDAAQKRIDV